MIEVFLILYGLLANCPEEHGHPGVHPVFLQDPPLSMPPRTNSCLYLGFSKLKKKKGFMIVATVLIIIPKLIRYFLNLCRWNFSYYIFIIRIYFIFGSNAWPEIRFFLPELANLSFQPIFYYLCCRNVFVKICLTPIRNLRCDKELDKINR